MPVASDPSESKPWRTAIVLLFGLLWLTVAAGAFGVSLHLSTFSSMAPVELAEVAAGLVLQIAAPLALIVVAITLLRRPNSAGAAGLAEIEARNRDASAATTTIRDGLIDIDATLAAIASRLDGLRLAANADSGGLIGVAARVETAAALLGAATTAAGNSAQTLLTVLPDAQGQVDAVSRILAQTGDETARQIEQIETMLAAVWSRNVDARDQVETASATMAGLLAGLEQASRQAGATIAERVDLLGSSVDAVLGRTTAALDDVRDGVQAQTAALVTTVEQSRLALDQIGDDASRAIAKRIDRVVAATSQLGEQLGEQDKRTRAMIEVVERSFTVLDAKLGHAATMSHSTLDGIAARMTAVRDQVHAIGTPLGETSTALRDAEASVARLAADTATTLALLGDGLPAHRASVADLSRSVADLSQAATGLAQPMIEGRSAIVDAGVAFDAQRATLEAAALRLAEHLYSARQTLIAIESQTEGSALAATNQLIEVLSRVREVANATAGTMHDTLAGVVAEAEAALDRAGTERAAAAFGLPIRAEIAAVEDASTRAGAAAQASADRIAQRLLGLTQTVATVEARIEQADARFDDQLRDDLGRRSAGLLDSLKSDAVDIARILSVNAGDADWAAYLKGDRSLFARRTAQMIDAGTARAIVQHYKADPVFAAQASRYIDLFESLLKRVLPLSDGRALAVTLVSSDIGKVYVALAQALERLR